jgi:hypothetical protein
MKNPAASSGVSSFREECDCMWGYIPYFVDVTTINRPKGRGMYPTNGINKHVKTSFFRVRDMSLIRVCP